VKACVCQSVNGVRAEAARVVKLTGRLGRGRTGDLGTVVDGFKRRCGHRHMRDRLAHELGRLPCG